MDEEWGQVILKGLEVDFPRAFHTRDDENEHFSFYKARRKYYDDSYGYSDVVFAAVKSLEARSDTIPSYDQVLVDEFQDFNLLEVSLINLLAERSPVLVAGDDDQALYDFKHADPKHIRDLHRGSEFESFTLPLCSRCPRVVIAATNHVVESATKNGRLLSRIPKAYEYFDSEAKDAISDRYPRLTRKTLHAPQFPWYISKQLGDLLDGLRQRFSVLIIAPYKKQAKSIAIALTKMGFQAVDFVDRDDREITLRDGLERLLIDPKSNLGWRIIAGFRLPKDDVKALLQKTENATPPLIIDLVPPTLKKETKQALTALRRLRDGETPDADQLSLLKAYDVDPLAVGLNDLSRELSADPSAGVRPGLRRLPIKVTTIQSSKGLAADVVFITHLDDVFWITKEGMTDRDVCNFLVALTRAKTKVFLLSSQKVAPTFVNWIKPERIEET
ncbi:MAG TPA: UvrD-helicase domain-containing protein [Acidobacteriaceae bacterium]|nr:UvrD-helicase domain-containing protein [Acidobacteriaceae bacterium]